MASSDSQSLDTSLCTAVKDLIHLERLTTKCLIHLKQRAPETLQKIYHWALGTYEELQSSQTWRTNEVLPNTCSSILFQSLWIYRHKPHQTWITGVSRTRCSFMGGLQLVITAGADLGKAENSHNKRRRIPLSASENPGLQCSREPQLWLQWSSCRVLQNVMARLQYITKSILKQATGPS